VNLIGRPLPEITAATPADVAACAAEGRPVVLRRLTADWPAVRAAREDRLAGYLRGLDRGGEGDMFIGPPEIEGRPFYNADLSGFNFERTRRSMVDLLSALDNAAGQAQPQMFYMGSVPASALLPDFTVANPSPGVPPGVEPRLWIGNATTVQTHYDLSDNLACAVGGQRVFTLFPPEQVANLYVGPLDFTPAGQPISLVQFDRDDWRTAYPRFEAAAEAALHAVLEPGDAVFIPSLWWHHVRATAPLSMLVNYWWDAGPAEAPSPFDAMVLSLAALRGLPVERRQAWRAFYDHYVFEADEETHVHLPPIRRGVLGPLTPTTLDRIRRFVVAALSRR
jgi:hypothetical protein